MATDPVAETSVRVDPLGAEICIELAYGPAAAPPPERRPHAVPAPVGERRAMTAMGPGCVETARDWGVRTDSTFTEAVL